MANLWLKAVKNWRGGGGWIKFLWMSRVLFDDEKFKKENI